MLFRSFVGTVTAGTFIGDGSKLSGIVTNATTSTLVNGTATFTLGTTGVVTATNSLYAATIYSNDGNFRGPSGYGQVTLASGGEFSIPTNISIPGGLIKGPGGSTHIGLLSGTGGAVKFYSTATVAGTTSATSTTTGALTVAGGLGVGGTVYASAFVGNGSGLTNITATVSDAAPSTPTAGQLWYESDVGKLKIYYSNTWVDASPAAGIIPYRVKETIVLNNQASSGTFNGSATVTNWTSSYTGSGGNIKVTMSFTAWASSSGQKAFSLQRDGVTVATVNFYFRSEEHTSELQSH